MGEGSKRFVGIAKGMEFCLLKILLDDFWRLKVLREVFCNLGDWRFFEKIEETGRKMREVSICSPSVADFLTEYFFVEYEFAKMLQNSILVRFFAGFDR